MWMCCEGTRPARGNYLNTRRYAQRANSGRECGDMNEASKVGPREGRDEKRNDGEDEAISLVYSSRRECKLGQSPRRTVSL